MCKGGIGMTKKEAFDLCDDNGWRMTMINEGFTNLEKDISYDQDSDDRASSDDRDSNRNFCKAISLMEQPNTADPMGFCHRQTNGQCQSTFSFWVEDGITVGRDRLDCTFASTHFEGQSLTSVTVHTKGGRLNLKRPQCDRKDYGVHVDRSDKFDCTDKDRKLNCVLCEKTSGSYIAQISTGLIAALLVAYSMI
jgi:hypothetical protein